MLAEINFVAQNLKLPIALPVTEERFRKVYLTDARGGQIGGRLETDQFAFCFVGKGHLSYIIRLQDGTSFAAGKQPSAGVPAEKYFGELARISSVIGTNEAYTLAVDTAALERENPPRVEQLTFKGRPLPCLLWNGGEG